MSLLIDRHNRRKSPLALAGTAACCLLFLLKDKRVAPLGFAGLAVVLGMFCAAALMLEGEARSLMLRLITLYGLSPVLLGNATAWPIYLKIKRGNPAPDHRKTVRQELMEAAAGEAAKQERPETPRETFAAPPAPSPEEETLFGPESGGGPGSFRSEEEEVPLYGRR